jgi:hypothetical protein
MHFSLHTTVPANGSCCPAAQLYSQSLLMPVHPSWSDPIPLYLQLKKNCNRGFAVISRLQAPQRMHLRLVALAASPNTPM